MEKKKIGTINQKWLFGWFNVKTKQCEELQFNITPSDHKLLVENTGIYLDWVVTAFHDKVTVTTYIKGTERKLLTLLRKISKHCDVKLKYGKLDKDFFIVLKVSTRLGG